MTDPRRGASGRAAQVAARATYDKAKGAKEPPVVIYQIDNWQFARLLEIQQRLFGDGTSLTSDGRRDLANSLWVLTREIKDQVQP
jgi:hypothetical protein